MYFDVQYEFFITVKIKKIQNFLLYSHGKKDTYPYQIRTIWIQYHTIKVLLGLFWFVTDATRQRVKKGSEQGSYANRH